MTTVLPVEQPIIAKPMDVTYLPIPPHTSNKPPIVGVDYRYVEQIADASYYEGSAIRDAIPEETISFLDEAVASRECLQFYCLV